MVPTPPDSAHLFVSKREESPRLHLSRLWNIYAIQLSSNQFLKQGNERTGNYPRNFFKSKLLSTQLWPEAKQLLTVLRTANNPGIVWAGWKKRAKKFFQEYHIEYLLAKNRVSDMAQRDWMKAQDEAKPAVCRLRTLN